MSDFVRSRSMSPPVPLGRALLIGILVSVIYIPVAVGFALIVGPGFSGSGPPGSLLIMMGFAFGSIGVPIVLWLRFEYYGPVALMSVIVLLLTFAMPLVAPGSGDSPAFALVIYWAPFYLVFYVVIVGIEYLYQHRSSLYNLLRN